MLRAGGQFAAGTTKTVRGVYYLKCPFGLLSSVSAVQALRLNRSPGSAETRQLPIPAESAYSTQNEMNATLEPSCENPWPKTVIVVHARENRRKCSVHHLRDHPAFQFIEYRPLSGAGAELIPPMPSEATRGLVRLGFGGPVLRREDGGRRLLILDATWRHVRSMENCFETVEVRSLPTALTAYPRVSKLRRDPPEGLATIEAIYLAHCILGRPLEGLLEPFRWRREFLESNEKLLQSLRNGSR